jgi:hypothetical protein
MNLRRFSFLATTALCAFIFLFGAPSAQAARIIGTLYVKGTVLMNGQTASNGASVENCAKIQTRANPAKVALVRGGYVLIKPYSRVRVCDFENEPIDLAIVYGGAEVHNLDNKKPPQWLAGWFGTEHGQGEDTGAEPLPYLAAFGFGNFPAGGGSSSPSGNVLSVVLPNGHIVFFGGAGNFIGFR